MDAYTSIMSSATRYITKAKCKDCGIHTSALSVGQDARRRKDDPKREAPGPGVYTHARTGSFVIDCRGCGRAKVVRAVAGKISERHVCGARCMASTGPNCECSCGGQNHGASFATA